MEGDYTLVKTYEYLAGDTYIYRGNRSGKCYLEGYRELTEVDCIDHGVGQDKVSPQLDKYDFIKNYCTKVRRGMNGKYYAQCEVPEEVIDRQEHLRLKEKLGDVK